MEPKSILSVFVPPEGYRGDFGYVCGFTAHSDILREIVARFTDNVRRRRISIAVFMHSPQSYFPFMPGLQVLYRRGPLDFDLLHAKVALLRFVGDDRSMIRLVVSTGNWTHETLTDSIDLYWIAEWESDDPDGQAAADILAAAAMFDQLTERFDTTSLKRAAEGAPPEDGMAGDLARMRRSRRLPPSRFITNIARPLLDEIIDRATTFDTGRRTQLILGSGFFESGTQGVLPEIVVRCQDALKLTAKATVEVVLNASSCQGIAEQAKDLIRNGGACWRFVCPKTNGTQQRLHAKFLFSAGGKHNCTNAWCYIGSGNLSKRGMLVRASLNGNLEAGVVFAPQGLVWDDEKNPQYIGHYLPIGGKEEKPSDLVAGEDFEHPGPGVAAPPVSYLDWRDGLLHAPDTAPADAQITIVGPNGEQAALPFQWDPPPPVVTLAECLAQVPVLAQGGFVLPPTDPMRVEDVLAALPLFPEGLPQDGDSRDGAEEWGAGDPGLPIKEQFEYPVRRIMRLVVGFCDRQPKIKRDDWARWTNTCEELLVALVKLESELFQNVRQFGVDPLDALLRSEFLPDWLQPGDQDLEEHGRMLGRVRKAWKTESLQPLFGEAP